MIEDRSRDVAPKAGSPAKGNETAIGAPVCHVMYFDDCTAICSSERVCQSNRFPDRRNVVVRAAVKHVELQIGANTRVLDAAQRVPCPQGAAHTQIRIVGHTLPPADDFGGALAKTNLVPVVPAAFGGVSGVFPVDSGLEQDFLEWHTAIFLRLADSG